MIEKGGVVWKRVFGNVVKSKRKESGKKYATRMSPPFPVSYYCGKKKKGNDGMFWWSVKNRSGVCQ